jgi:hypothetical protein
MEPVAGLSRAELEPRLIRAVEIGDAETAEAIRAELAARTWQNINPYEEESWAGR